MTAYDRFGHKLFLCFKNRHLKDNGYNDYYINHFDEKIWNENIFHAYKIRYIK